MNDAPNDWSTLAVRARELIDAHTGAVSDPFSPAAREALTVLTEAIVAEGVPRKTAEFAVTRWIITKDPIAQCVAEESGESA